jgi:orotate phosphoribosyltransferase-like protein
MVDHSLIPVYLRITEKARQLRELGMSDRQIARTLGVSDKTVAKAISECAARSQPMQLRNGLSC